MLLAPRPQSALAAAPLTPIGAPQQQVAAEVRASIGHELVLAACRIGIHAVFPRIDDAERGGNHEAFAQRLIALCDHEQPRDARIHRQTRHELAI
jgi:hypothetical protein